MEARPPDPVRMRLATDDEALDGTVHCWSPYSFKSRYRCYNVQVTSKLNKRPLHVTSSEFICIGGGGQCVCVFSISSLSVTCRRVIVGRFYSSTRAHHHLL